MSKILNKEYWDEIDLDKNIFASKYYSVGWIDPRNLYNVADDQFSKALEDLPKVFRKEQYKVMANIKVALVDMDILIYRCGFANDKDGGDADGAMLLINTALKNIKEGTGCEEWVGFMSGGKENFRDKIAVTKKYKDRPSRKPEHYDTIRELLTWYNNVYTIEGQEADDALGINQQEGTCIVTIDKDLDQVPGWHFNPVTNELYKVDKLQGYRNFYGQVLTGDRVDTIPGLPGVGAVGAFKLLSKCNTEEEMFWTTLCKYEEVLRTRNGTLANVYPYFLEQARLVYIRRQPNELWEPKW